MEENPSSEIKEEIKEEEKEETKEFISKLPQDRPFITIEQMYEIGRKFAERIFNDPRIAPRLKASKMVINFKYYENPERWNGEEPEVTVDCREDEIKLYTGPVDIKPIVVMRMHADTAHKFWMQKINLMIAITKGEIKVKGPIPAVMRLLPVIKPSFQIYRELLKDLGYYELLAYPPDKKHPVTPVVEKEEKSC